VEVVTNITDVEFSKMIKAAAGALQENAEKINELNVFPVPDGDTGTNMMLSMASGAEYEAAEADTKVGALAKATSKGLLMGARGNSGVILSQIFRGFATTIADKDVLTARDLADAFMGGAETAYKAVMKPTEGTILTVIREGAAAANRSANQTDNAVEVMHATMEAAEKALASTPNLLPVLKEVGVVDSGGQGLTIVFQAFYAALSGEEISYTVSEAAGLEAKVKEVHGGAQAQINPEDIEFSYCTEIMVGIGEGTTYTKDFDYDEFYAHLADLGDSLLVINDDAVVKVHVHTENPGAVISWGTQYGDLQKVKVDNMREQQVDATGGQAQKANAKPKQDAVDLAIVTIASGEGFNKLFTAAGATVILDGSSAPSTQDLVKAVNATGAKRAIILPNDSNIFMAADQAIELTDIPTAVVRTRTMQQGLTSMVVGYTPEGGLEGTVTAMTGTLADIQSGAVTTSVRDTTLNGLEIHTGDAIGLLDGKIIVAVPDADIMTAAKQLMAEMLDEDSELVTIYYGEEATLEMAQELESYAVEVDDELEAETYDGGQPLYPILMSVE
jgi:hypothetical protein